MPIPRPTDNEDKEKFINRCMGDSVMNSEFPSNEQRFAVCNQKWKDRKKENKAETESQKEEE